MPLGFLFCYWCFFFYLWLGLDHLIILRSLNWNFWSFLNNWACTFPFEVFTSLCYFCTIITKDFFCFSFFTFCISWTFSNPFVIFTFLFNFNSILTFKISSIAFITKSSFTYLIWIT